MKNSTKRLVPILLVLLILASMVWYLFIYDRDFTRDMILKQARYHSTNGNPSIASWFYDMAYEYSGQDENVAIELANQFKAEGNFTKAEYTLTNAIADGGTAELYMALCRTYVEQDKLLDAVNMLDNIKNQDIKAEIDAIRPAAPVSDPVPGFYSQYIPVNLSGTAGTLYYSTNGEYPSTDDAPYAEAFTLGGGETTIYAVCVEDGLVSPLSIFGFTIGGVIEEVHFDDASIETAARELIDRVDEDPLYSNELWNISSFVLPQNAKYVDDLTKMPYLKHLEITGHTLDSLRFLSSLNELEELTLSKCHFKSEELSVIAALPNLKRLTISDCGLSTIAGLERAQNLEYLNLSNNTIRNLEPLSNLMKLQEIDLQHNALTSLNALSVLSNLRALDVSYNSLTSIAPIATCTKLNRLNVNNNELTNLGALDNLSALNYLAASNNALTDIALLANNTSLVELYIANNDIENITDLASLTNLEFFDFSGNQVVELPAWPDKSKLRNINGSHNEIKSLENLKNQMNLTHVNMDYNKITSVDALENCYKLVVVNVYGNDIKQVDALTAHDIIVNWDPT